VSSQIIIAQKEDLAEVKKVIDASLSRFYRYFAWHSVQDRVEPTLVHQFDGALAGFAKLIHLEIDGSLYGCILWIAVHPQFRRRGIASALTQAILERFRAQGVRAIFASTQRHNIGALSTLKQAGFVRVEFLGLRRLFSWSLFRFYGAIWFAPGEVVLMSGPYFDC
jgi:ribosomal protein S18 acetylase RimI-like enzyme